METKKRVIIIENDDALLQSISDKLNGAGYVVEGSQDSIVAVDRIRVNKPDCIILDISTLAQKAVEVLESFYSDPMFMGVSIVVLLSAGQLIEMQRARELGVREFIIKEAFSMEEVLEKVKMVLSSGPIDPPQDGANTYIQNAVIPNGEVVKEKPFILVVEDDRFLRELLIRKLAKEGFEVKNAIEAEAAFAILRESKPKAILCDLILPGIDGFEILKKVKSDPKLADIPFVVLSNLGQKEDLERAMALGAKDFMVKANFTLDEIVDKVRSVL